MPINPANEFSLTDMLRTAVENRNVRNVAMDNNAAAKDEAAASGQATVDAITKQGEAAATSIGEKGNLALITQAELDQIRTAAMPADVLIDNARRVREAQAAVTSNMAQQQKLESIDAFSNPIAFILAQLQLPAAQSATARSQQVLDTETTNANNIAGMVTAQAQAIKQTAKTTTLADINAQQEAARSEANAKAAAAKIEMLRTDAWFTRNDTELRTQELNEQLSMRNAVQQDQMWALQMENARMQREKLRAELDDKKATDEFVRAQAATAVAQARMLGKNSLADDLSKVTSIPQMRIMLQNPSYKYLIETGNATKDGGRLVLGGDVLEAEAAVRTLGVDVAKFSPGLAQVLAQVQNTRASLADNPDYQAAKSKEEREAVFRKALYADISRSTALAPSAVVEKYRGAASDLSTLPMFKAVEFDTNKAVQGDPKELLRAVKSAVASGKLSVADAADGLRTFALRANDLTNQYYGFNQIGLPGKSRYFVDGVNHVVNGQPQNYDFTRAEDALTFALKSRQSVFTNIYGTEGAAPNVAAGRRARF